jgi:serine/threonine protein kinase
MVRFRSLLASRGITPSQPVIMQLVRNFASSLAFVSEADVAEDLYYSASRIPRSATALVLKERGISVAQPYQASDPSKAILMHAFRDGYPMILKVSSAASVQHEADVIKGMTDSGCCELSEKHLCRIEVIQFESASIELTEASGSICTPFPRVRQGLLMKHYQTTLAQCKIPLTASVLLKYGNQLKVAISHMHQMGYCHLDIKPANIFLLEGDCFLGDFGAATKIGLEIKECTRIYYPNDGPFLAEKKTDFLLLVKTLMELFGAITTPVVPMSADEIMKAVRNIDDQTFKDFLLACFDDNQAGV